MKPDLAAQFIASSVNPLRQRHNPLPEIIILGRSNVGKSSLINCLVGQKNLARTSSTPGKTRLFYFYEIANRFLIVDPPGYGYAQVSREIRSRWMREMERYLRQAEMLLGVILIMDARHAPMPIDLEMAGWLAESRIPALYVLNKVDKLTRSKRSELTHRCAAGFSFEGAGLAVPFSCVTREGREEVWNAIEEWLKRAQ